MSYKHLVGLTVVQASCILAVHFIDPANSEVVMWRAMILGSFAFLALTQGGEI